MTASTVSNTKILDTIHEMQREIGAKVDNLTTKTHELHTQFSVMSKTVDQISNTSEESRRTLRGTNGNEGLVASVEAVKRRIEQLEIADQKCGIGDVVRTLHGTDKDPGLMERVRELEDLAGAIRKWIYLAGSAVVLGVISLLFDVIPKIAMLIEHGG